MPLSFLWPDIQHIQSIEKEGEGCVIHYLSQYTQLETELRFNVTVEDVVSTIHDTIKELESKIERSENTCPKCGKPIKICKGKAGYYFIGCSGYPFCSWGTPLDAWMNAEEDPEKWKEQRKKMSLKSII